MTIFGDLSDVDVNSEAESPAVTCTQEAQAAGEYNKRQTALRRYVPFSSHESSHAVSEAQVTIKSVTARIERVCKCNATQSIVVLSRKNLVHDQIEPETLQENILVNQFSLHNNASTSK